MPHAIPAAHAPSGLSVRVDRYRHDGLSLRTWTMSREQSAGAANRPDFVLIHGLGVSSTSFGRLAQRLAEVGVVHLLDLPGFAGVPHPGRGLEMTEFADLVRWWARRVGLSAPVVAVGHSMGAQIVVEALVRDPALAGHSVLVGPTVNRAERSTLMQALRLLQGVPFETSRARRTTIASYLRCGPYWFHQVLPRMLAHPIEDRIAHVTAPVLIIRGERDAVAPRPWCDHLAAQAPTATVVEVPGAGHGVVLSDEEEIARLVLEHARS